MFFGVLSVAFVAFEVVMSQHFDSQFVHGYSLVKRGNWSFGSRTAAIDPKWRDRLR
jgi:hypothetical protein